MTPRDSAAGRPLAVMAVEIETGRAVMADGSAM
jgi:hypothetical protein